MNTVFFPGSFNPFTKGHADIVERMLGLCHRVIIGIGCNAEKPESLESAAARADEIRTLYNCTKYQGRVAVVCYSGLTIDKARETGADCMVRGVRNATDFDYEYALASANREVFGIETLLLPANPSLAFISSSVIRDLRRNNAAEAADRFLPSSEKPEFDDTYDNFNNSDIKTK